MRKIDTHTHCFPDALAGRALSSLAARSHSRPFGDGTYGALRGELETSGVTAAVLLHIATKPSQMTDVNDFAARCQNENIFCFGSVYPTAPEALAELDRIRALGLYGVKFHPDYQNFYANDPAVFPVYARIAELGLPAVFHAGRDPLCPDDPHCTPEMLAEVAARFPSLTVVAAHMGGMEMTDEAEKHLVGLKNVYFDTAFASRWLTPERLGTLIRRHGAERILFATDYPWSTAAREEALLHEAGLSASERSLILWENAVRAFHLPLG